MSTPPPPSPLDALQPNELAQLRDLGLDSDSFEELARLLREGRLPSNEVEGELAIPSAGLVQPPAPTGTMQGDALVDAGLQLLNSGRAGLVLLNGGMATRFGGRVKGVVDALPGRSFLGLQAGRMAELRRSASRPAPLLLMNSQATEAASRQHLEEHGFFGMDPEDVFCFTQSAAPRLRGDGSLFRGEDGAISIYGPGHGDLLPSLRRSGALQWARERGVDCLLMANVDNLGASLDPALLGHFVASGSEIMVELAERLPGERGGSPCSVDGRVQIIEDFAFPEGFDKQSIPWFNTNTLWFRTEALDQDFPLRWYAVHKEAEGEDVVQFERLVGQVTWFLSTCWAPVSRERFLPVKTPGDLEALQPRLKQLFRRGLEVL